VYMLVAQRLKMPFFGVNLPNLFVLTYKSDEATFYINAFNRGMIFTRTDIDDYIAKLKLAPNPIFYEPCSHIDIVLRVLRNLALSFENLGDIEKLNEIKNILKVMGEMPPKD
jgi:regulator of sirC expression with transglutaminase-like and TPR domain